LLHKTSLFKHTLQIGAFIHEIRQRKIKYLRKTH
jgi:hypothetical protein